MQSPIKESLSPNPLTDVSIPANNETSVVAMESVSTLVDSTAPNPLTDVSIPANNETSVVAMETELRTKADVIVSQDGTGKFRTINEAVAAAPVNSKVRFTIYVKKGIYNEIVKIGKNQPNITIIGDGSESTVITGKIHADKVIRTYDTATLAVDGDMFMAQHICIRNTAGPENGQAVALRMSSDMSVLFRCKIDAYQDTLYAHSKKQFYRECFITGTVDFIFGHASAVFQCCQIEARSRMKGGDTVVITAQSRDERSLESAFTIQNCRITANSDLPPTAKVFLGRPWAELSRVVIMQSEVGAFVDPAGWTPWTDEKKGLSTLFYAEYDNRGPGADTSRRVKWEGYHIIKNPKDVAIFTVGQLLQGDSWLKTTGVPYQTGL